MEIEDLEILWNKAISELLEASLDKRILSVLARQSYDSIRRIGIYKTYKIRAIEGAKKELSFFHTSNPFILAQRTDLSVENKIWVIYLATYFGKSNASGWDLFDRAAFDQNKSFIKFEQINSDPEKYFYYLESFDFFEGSKFSNHRKYTKKALLGRKGLFRSMTYFFDNIREYCNNEEIEFHDMYKRAAKIPNFGRLASFDFTSSLVKCGLKIAEPKSMYAGNSTGPLQALALLLRLTGSEVTLQAKKELSYNLVEWFNEHSDIFMVGQVLEDSICNWQKNPERYIRYTG